LSSPAAPARTLGAFTTVVEHGHGEEMAHDGPVHGRGGVRGVMETARRGTGSGWRVGGAARSVAGLLLPDSREEN